MLTFRGLFVCLSRSCIVLKWQKISTCFLIFQIVLKFGLHQLTPSTQILGVRSCLRESRVWVPGPSTVHSGSINITERSRLLQRLHIIPDAHRTGRTIFPLPCNAGRFFWRKLGTDDNSVPSIATSFSEHRHNTDVIVEYFCTAMQLLTL